MAIVDTSLTADAARRLCTAGVDFVQVRDPGATAGELLRCAERILRAAHGSRTKVLMNSRADVALAVGAQGVHLRSHASTLTPSCVRLLYARHGLSAPIVSAACHTISDIVRAKENNVHLAVFGPVFEKRVAGELLQQGVGIDRLAEACSAAGTMPVLALGGVDSANADACIAAGAAGIAGIRLFR